jgi:hypothetical protein
MAVTDDVASKIAGLLPASTRATPVSSISGVNSSFDDEAPTIEKVLTTALLALSEEYHRSVPELGHIRYAILQSLSDSHEDR